MSHLVRIAGLVLAVLAMGLASAYADHMNGSYTGVGIASGTNIDLQQDGIQISGQISGEDTGTIAAQSDGSDNFRGTITLVGVGQIPMQGYWANGSIVMTLAGLGTFEFATLGSEPEPGPDPEPEPEPEPGPAPASYYYLMNGAQQGPVDRAAFEALLADGTIGRNTLIWQPGQAEWMAAGDFPDLAELLPPPPPAEAQYYVLDDGQQVGPLGTDAVMDRIAEGTTEAGDLAWTEGMEAWAPIGEMDAFADAFPEEVAPPPPPPVVEDEIDDPAAPPPPPPPPEDESSSDPVPHEDGGHEEGDVHDEAAGAGDALDLLFETLREDGLAEGAPVAQIDAIVGCYLDLYADVDPTLREEVAASEGDMSSDLEERLEAEHPGILEAGLACEEAGDDLVEDMEDAADDVEPANEDQDASEDADPADGGSSETSGDALDQLFEQFRDIGAEEGMAPAEIEALIGCYVEAFADVSQQDREQVASFGMSVPTEEQDRLEDLYPGIGNRVDACDSGGPASSSMSLPDGRMLTVVGGSSTDLTMVDGGISMVVDGVGVSMIDGVLTVDGEELDVPEFDNELEVTVGAEGAVTLAADPE